MIKNLSFEKKNSVGNFYTKIQKIAEKDTNKKLIPYQYKEFDEIFKKKLKKKIKKNFKIIDVGCGFFGGFLPFIYKENYKNLHACDINDNTIKNIKKKYKFINISKGSCLKLPYKKNSFDFVICYGVIHHTHNYSLALKELSRILKKNGTLFLGVYAFYGSLFEYLVRIFRWMGKKIDYKYFEIIAKKWPLFNRFFMDHTYVPILYLIHRKKIIRKAYKAKLFKYEEFSSKTDFFQKIPILNKLISGDGLLRIYLFRKI